MKKTLFLFDQMDGSPFFFEKEGNFTHLNGAYINSCEIEESIQDELNEILSYDDNGQPNVTKLSSPTRDWDFFVIVGFLP